MVPGNEDPGKTPAPQKETTTATVDQTPVQDPVAPKNDAKNNDKEEDPKKSQGKQDAPKTPKPAPEEGKKKEREIWLDRSDQMMNAGWKAAKEGGKNSPILKTAREFAGAVASPITKPIKALAGGAVKAERMRKKLSSQAGDMRREAGAAIGKASVAVPKAIVKAPVKLSKAVYDAAKPKPKPKMTSAPNTAQPLKGQLSNADSATLRSFTSVKDQIKKLRAEDTVKADPAKTPSNRRR